MLGDLRAETVTIIGHDGDEIEAYLARPFDSVPFGGVVVIHHGPGYDAATKEMVRTFAAHGYAALCPNLYYRQAPGASSDDVAAAFRAAVGVPDQQVVGDVDGAARYLRALDGANGKIGVIGHSWGGRLSFLVAVTSLLDRAAELSCPLLGLFGAEDLFPDPDEVATLDEELTRLGKEHEFHIYDGAGHAFFEVDWPHYRAEAAVDGWQKIFDFCGTHLAA